MSNKIIKVSIHPNSRKAQIKKRLILRDYKMDSRKATIINKKFIPLIDRVTWFQYYFDKMPIQKEIQQALTDYLNRNDATIEELKQKIKTDRPFPRKLLEIEELKKIELAEFTKNGIELPICHTNKGFEVLKSWNGDYNSLNQLEKTKYYLK